MVPTEPTSILSHLHGTDGSATFSQSGHTILASVNGPIEVQRRDELPEEAAIDVVVRPAAGVGGTRERHLELVIENVLRQIILIQNFPRTLIQVTIQIANPYRSDASTTQRIGDSVQALEILPAVLQATVLALISANIPLSSWITTSLLAIDGSDDIRHIVEDRGMSTARNMRSVHVFVFTSHGDLLLNESEGEFSLEDWIRVHDRARHSCDRLCSVDPVQVASGDHRGAAMKNSMQLLVAEKVEKDMYWRH